LDPGHRHRHRFQGTEGVLVLGLCRRCYRRLCNLDGGLVLDPRPSPLSPLPSKHRGGTGPGPASLLSPPSLGLRGRSGPGSASQLPPPSSEHREGPAPESASPLLPPPSEYREGPGPGPTFLAYLAVVYRTDIAAAAYHRARREPVLTYGNVAAVVTAGVATGTAITWERTLFVCPPEAGAEGNSVSSGFKYTSK